MLTYKRGPGKNPADYKFAEIFAFYKETYKDTALPKDVVRKLYSKLFPAIVKLMVFENLDYRMPSRLGYIRVKKKLREPKLYENGDLDTRGLAINWKATKKLWQKIYPDKTAEEIKAVEGKPLVRELNEDNGGYRLMWYWDKSTSAAKNQNAYYINLSRSNDQILSKGVRFNNLNFYE